MRRWHQDKTITLREWRKHRRSHVESNKGRRVGYGDHDTPPYTDPFVVTCDCDEQIGRFRKKDAWDCGNTRCYICHGDKFPKRDLSRQEVAAGLSLREQLKEI